MAARVAFVLVLSLWLAGARVPGRLELFNPDAEAGTASRAATKRGWTLPRG